MPRLTPECAWCPERWLHHDPHTGACNRCDCDGFERYDTTDDYEMEDAA